MDDRQAFRDGMEEMGAGMVGRPLPLKMPVPDAYLFRAGECHAAALVFAAAGNEPMAKAMSQMAETWLKIARDA